MVRSVIALALVTLGLSQPHAGTVPASAPAVHLLIVEEPRVPGADDRGFRIDSAGYDEVWHRGSVVVRDFPLTIDYAIDLELESFEVVAANARFIVARDERESSFVPPRMRFFRGTVTGEVDSSAYLWMHDGAIGGFVRVPNVSEGVPETYLFGPAESPVGTRSDESNPSIRIAKAKPAPGDHFCETCRELPATGSAWVLPFIGKGGVSDALLKAQVAFDTTATYFPNFDDAEQATAYALQLLGAVSAIYERDLGCLIELTYFRLHEGDSPYSDQSFDPRTLVDELQQEWTTNPALQSVPRDAVQLLHSPGAFGGDANFHSLCDDSLAYSASYVHADYSEPLLVWSYDLYVVAHEFGHVFGADHTHCFDPPIDRCGNWPGCYEGPIVQTPGTIMSYCDEIDYVFHELVIDRARPFLEAATCLDVAGQPSEILGGPGQGLLVGQGPLVAHLASDDGSAEAVVGAPGAVRLAWVKQFIPPCHPVVLKRIDVLIHDASVQPGRPLQLLVYVDPSASGQLGNATLVHSEAQTLQTVSQDEWNQYALSSPLTVATGDLYVGFYDLDADAQTTFLAHQDSSHSGDSYWAWDTVDPGDFALQNGATWMVRAQAECDTSTLFLSWDEPCNALEVPGQDFGIYQGTLAQPFDDHTALTCTTGRSRSFMLSAMPSGDAYFVVVPSTSDGEGSYGTIPPAESPCKSPNVADCPAPR